MNPACQTFFVKLSPFIDGELAPAERQLVERHLSACSECTMRVADLRAESGLVRLGLEMAADEVDFRDFAQKVMARVIPEKPPLGERARLWVTETFLYQRRIWMTSLATAAVVVAIAVPTAMRLRTPAGYAGERMMVETVEAESGATVAPVVFKTDEGDSIIWMIDQPPAPDESAAEEVGMDSAPETGAPAGSSMTPDSGHPRPSGGDL